MPFYIICVWCFSEHMALMETVNLLVKVLLKTGFNKNKSLNKVNVRWNLIFYYLLQQLFYKLILPNNDFIHKNDNQIMNIYCNKVSL